EGRYRLTAAAATGAQGAGEA
ncbi:TIGR02594 family protein, partial [Neisseria gonorrhoeae]